MGAEKHKIEVYGLVTDHKFHQAKVTAEVCCLKSVIRLILLFTF